MTGTDWEQAEAVVAYAAANGERVTREQLARWHRTGIIPRPVTRHRVGERGTESLYPPGTALQVVAASQIHKEERRLGHVAFSLWWEGFPVESSLVHAFAAKVSVGLDEASLSFAGFLDPSGELTPEAKASVADLTTRAPSAIRQVHRRANRRGTDPTGFAQVVTAMARLAVRRDIDATPEQLPTLRRGLGLDAEHLGLLTGEAAAPDNESESGLELMQGFFAGGRFSEALGRATDEELAATRDRTRLMFGALSSFGRVLRDLRSASGAGLKLLSSALDEWTRNAEGLCHLLLLVLVISDQDQMREAMEALRESFARWSTEGVRHWQLIRQLRADVPELRPILTPQRLRRSIGSESERKRLQDDLTRARQKYASKIDVVVAAHPELAPEPVPPNTT